ncbi:MAG: gamma-glutamyltransferase [Acidobacteria bacterium]|nr:gamma-glutamyltransferase [Acidobacteriota bacterium]
MRFTLKAAFLLALAATLAVATPSSRAAQERAVERGQPETAEAPNGMIVADEPLAAQAGLEILRQGGNAIDAAVAVAFALAVTHPQAGNLGGGGFMLIRLAHGQSLFLDYRETAPAAAHAEMYLDASGKLIPGASTAGWRAAAVPGTVAGLELALKTYGTMALKDVMAPAIRLAQKGFRVSPRLASNLAEDADRLRHSSEARRLFFPKKGRPLEPGQLLRQPQLALTLKKIARGGAREFYHGSIAERLASEMKSHRGLITRDDLARYRPQWRQPLTGRFRGYEILTAPPPSSGGVALLEMLALLDPWLGPETAALDPATIHLVAEALRRAFADRARFLADPDFACVPVAELLDPARVEKWQASMDPARASVSQQLTLPEAHAGDGPGCAVTATSAAREGEETTHFAVIDAEGNVVANTYTINDLFGSGVLVPGLGFFLNNEMDDFATHPGGANVLYNLVESAANRIEPGKRPLSSMTPTIVLRDGQPVLVLGSPGGPRIISALLLVLLNRLVFERPLAEAVALPRYHHQWLPDALFVEEGVFTEAQLEALRRRGHEVKPIAEVSASRPKSVGHVNAIERDPRTRLLTGVGDARRGGVVRGH